MLDSRGGARKNPGGSPPLYADREGEGALSYATIGVRSRAIDLVQLVKWTSKVTFDLSTCFGREIDGYTAAEYVRCQILGYTGKASHLEQAL